MIKRTKKGEPTESYFFIEAEANERQTITIWNNYVATLFGTDLTPQQWMKLPTDMQNELLHERSGTHFHLHLDMYEHNGEVTWSMQHSEEIAQDY